MIDRIILASVRHRFLVFFLVAAACVAGWVSMRQIPLDAIPDPGETQVIVFSRWDRSPDLVESQVTYPIISALLGAPKVKAIRGYSDFGYSYVHLIFEEGTDLYWARSRTQEYLASVIPKLPQGATTLMGPDATALGWIYQYALVDTSGKHSLASLRSYQDWYLGYHLRAVPGVAEVAAVGGFGKQFQVNVDPNRLRAHGLSISRVVEAVRKGNRESSGRLIELGGREYMVRGHGYVGTVSDLEEIVLDYQGETPIRIRDVGEVVIGPDLRRGVADLDGRGEVVSGIVVMRQGANALEVIGRVKNRIREIEPGLPEGMRIVPVYDRSDLILRAISNLRSTLIEIVITVALVVLVFLWHPPSAVIPVITIPVTVLIAFIPFRLLGVSANIMSLCGIAIAVGALVDAAIVVVEQVHKNLEQWERNGRPGDEQSVVLRGIQQVAAPSFFALLVIAVSFLPVLTLEAQEGSLFKPLAYTKSLSMIVAAVLTITFDPALRITLTRLSGFKLRSAWLSGLLNALVIGRIRPESEHPISRTLVRLYDPALTWALRFKNWVLGAAAALVLATLPAFLHLGTEFMPPLEEGSLLYMPSTMPGISITEAQKLLQTTDAILHRFPEVDQVLGKAGRAETPTDPAPLSMLETVITLKPKSEWRRVPTWYSSWAPEWLQTVLQHITPRTISQEALVQEMNASLQVPGLANGWTMPIKGRIEMLSTGFRTPIGIKISGADLTKIEQLATQVETVLRDAPGTRSVFAERTGSGFYLDIDWNRAELARNGLNIEAAQSAVENAIGGENVSTVIQGQERYPINVRYKRDFRSSPEELERVLVSSEDGKVQVPLGKVGKVRLVNGPAMIRNEDGLPTGYVYVDASAKDLQGYMDQAGQRLREAIKLPPGYSWSWSGQYEAMQRVRQRLWTIIPLTLLLIVLLLYFSTRCAIKTLIVLLAVPFSAIGAVWFLHFLGYQLSVGVWVGMIALLGVDAETGVFMLVYLDQALQQASEAGRLRNVAELQHAIRQGAVQRLRPKFMTVATMLVGLLPIMWSSGTGADVMKRIAAPMIGGIVTSFILELLVYPAIYLLWKSRDLPRQGEPVGSGESASAALAAS